MDKKSSSNDESINELEDIGKEAKLPEELIEFLIETDNLTLPKKARRKNKNDMEKSNWDLFWEMLACKRTMEIPDSNYYNNGFTKFFFYMATSDLFNTFIMIIIITNTFFLAFDRYPEMDEGLKSVLDGLNLVFTVIFTLEVVIKMIGLGLKRYASDGFNIFDLLTVIVSFLEIIMGDGSGSFGALRAFRLFRVFKLFKADNLRVLIDSILFTLTTIGNYTVLLILFIYVYAMLGMQFFAGKMRFNEDTGLQDLKEGVKPRTHFDSIGWACLTVF